MNFGKHLAGLAIAFIAILVPANVPRYAVAATQASHRGNPALSSLGIPEALRPQWRKFGIWDYKQTDSKYRDFTKFNYGATGSAAKIPKEKLLALASASRPTPADLDFITSVAIDSDFAAHRKQLDQLRAMVDEDRRLVRIAADFTLLENDTKWPRDDLGFSKQRWDKYREFFDRMGLQEGVVRSADYPGAIFFIIHARGIVTGGAGVGYVHSERELSPVTGSPQKDLDALARASPKKGSAMVFRKLADRWYAFYQLDW